MWQSWPVLGSMAQRHLLQLLELHRATSARLQTETKKLATPSRSPKAARPFAIAGTWASAKMLTHALQIVCIFVISKVVGKAPKSGAPQAGAMKSVGCAGAGAQPGA